MNSSVRSQSKIRCSAYRRLAIGIPVLSEIERWIAEHGSATVLKEHLAFLQVKLTALREEVALLERENAELKQQVIELEGKLKTATVAEHFIEERGALFKRRTNGEYHNAVYCPKCRQSASPFPPCEEFNCACGWFSSFTERELPNILRELPAA